MRNVGRICALAALVTATPNAVALVWAGEVTTAGDGSRADDIAPDETEDDDALVEELFLTETAAVQDQGEVQGTFVVAADRDPARSAGTAALGLEVGLTSWLQVGAEVPTRVVSEPETAAGIGRIEAGVLAGGALSQASSAALAGGVDVAFPSVDERVDESSYAIEPGLRVGWAWAAVQLAHHVSLELEVPAGSDDLEWGGGGALAVFGRVGPVVPVLEVQGELGEESVVRGGPGLVWPIAEAVEVGVSAYGGTTAEGPLYGGSFVAVVEQPLLGVERP